jgi:energy-coupling factor transporter ATP-binding protein EcfA2
VPSLYPVHEVNHQQWSHRRVTLICGPPGSGKSTLARQLNANVAELEMFADMTDDHRLQLRGFGRLCPRIGRAPNPDYAVVRGAPTLAERQHHERMVKPHRTIVLLTPADVCHHRIDDRGRLRTAGEHEAVDQWWTAWNADHAA